MRRCWPIVTLLPLLLAACRYDGGGAPRATFTPFGVAAVRVASPRVSASASASPGGAPPEDTVSRTPATGLPAGTQASSDARLFDALTRGGLVIYLRDAFADTPPADDSSGSSSACSTRDVLADTARAQARGIGVALHELGIPLGHVLSGGDCRALSTAQLVLGFSTSSDDLTGLTGASGAERAQRIEALRTLLTHAPEPGVNTLLIGQQINLRDAVNINLTTAGEAAIFRPDSAGGFTLVARVLPERWPVLANAVLGARLQEYPVPPGAHPHDVAPAPDGTLWYTAQATGRLGRLDPATGATHEIRLGDGSAPHGVIVGPDGAPWVTDAGLNAIVRVDPTTEDVTVYPLPDDRPAANLNTAVFDAGGTLWFTGNAGIYGRLNPATGDIQVFDAPRGAGPYGITATDNALYFAALQGNYLGRVDPETGAATALDPPTAAQGARRAWADSRGRVWISEWNAGQIGVYDPASGAWHEWPLPGPGAQAYAVYVDEHDIVWLTDFTHNTLARFDPTDATFQTFAFPSADAHVRQLLGRPGEVWGAESGTDKLVVLRHP